MDGTIRLATPADAPAVRRIYAPYVEQSAVSFATQVPTVAALEATVEERHPTYPWLVCERDSRVAGYASAGPLRDRDAYRWTVELSVYVDPAVQREGVGRALYEALLDLLSAQGFASAYGVVTLPNPASVALHESLGFERVGYFADAGYKHGSWHDVGWFRRRIPDPSAPEAPRSLDDLPPGRAERALDP